MRTDGIHDMGGMHGFGPVVVPGGDAPYHERWEPRVFAISTLVGIEGLGKGGGRPIREEMAPEEYLRASYYERWLWSTEQRLLRKGTILEGEVDAWVERLRAGEEPPQRFDPDQTRRTLAAIRDAEPLGAGNRHALRRRGSRPRQAHATRRPYPLSALRARRDRRRRADPGSRRIPGHRAVQGPDEPVYAVAFRSEDLFGAQRRRKPGPSCSTSTRAIWSRA